MFSSVQGFDPSLKDNESGIFAQHLTSGQEAIKAHYFFLPRSFLFLIQTQGMNKHFKPNERELIKVASFFKRQSKKLIAEGKLGPENKQVEEAVDRFIEHMNQHANSRAFIVEQREYLKKLVKDNARCPQCGSGAMLKLAGSEKNEKGWKSNRYKCRKCNIYFTWNMPNNPVDHEIRACR